MVGEFIKVDHTDTQLIEDFLRNAGKSTETFRYFQKRPLSIVANHLYTCVYSIDATIVGYGHLDKEGENVWLGVAIAHDFTRKGIGRQVMNHLLEKARELKVRELRLSVDSSNTRAKNLYEDFNFTKFAVDNDIEFYKRSI